MLKHLSVENFTAFANADMPFSPGLNVFIGANGAGKSHILKLAYSVAKTSFGMKEQVGQSKANWQKALADTLVHTFRPDTLGRLARRQQGLTKATVKLSFENLNDALIEFSFSTGSKTEVQIGKTPTGFAPAAPVFIPTKELLSLFPGLIGLYKSYELSMDETYPDLCLRLNRPLLRGPRLSKVVPLLTPLEDAAGGEIRNEDGKFYLYRRDGSRLEIDLVAEGLRKLATLAFLLKNGSLTDNTTLFWDEPEANLNPKIIRMLAEILIELSSQGFQILIATHSLFLLKEFHILKQKNAHAKVRYFGMSINENGATTVVTKDSLEDLPEISSLEAELEQSDRFETALHDN